MAPAFMPLRALLAASFDARALRAEAERLAVDDLRALGSFAVQPHPLVHRVVAVALALLLSLASSHVDAGGSMMHVRSWAVLRLELLADSPALWRKLRARARQLETGGWVLSPAQIHFACQELLQFLLTRSSRELKSLRQEGELAYVLSLEPVARVSTIAAALGAWACLYLQHACEGAKCVTAPASPIKITLAACEGSACVQDQFVVDDRDEKTMLDRAQGGAVVLLTDRDWKAKTQGYEQRYHQPLPLSRPDSLRCQAQPLFQSEASACVSRRVALKVGGRYVLLHARVRPPSESVAWALFALDTNWSHSNRRSGGRPFLHLQRAFWIPFRPLIFQPMHAESATRTDTNSLSLSRLPRTALDSVLTQLACRAGMLWSRNGGSIPPVPFEGELIRGSTLLQSHFIVVSCDSPAGALPTQCGWSITAVGRAAFPLDESIAALRDEIVAALTRECSKQRSSTQGRQCAWSDFQFVYRDAFLPKQLEESTSAAAMLPVTVLLLPSSLKSSQKATIISKKSIPLRLQREVAERLLNCGTQTLDQHKLPELKTEAMLVQQPISNDSSQDQSTASIVTEILRNWESFVQLQRLQDDPTVVFQFSPEKKRVNNAAAIKRQSLDECLTSHEDDSDCKPKDTTPQQPRKKFNPRKEFLLPLYTTAEVISPSTALLSTPFTQQLLDQIKPHARLALLDELHVVHIQATNKTAQRSSDRLLYATGQDDAIITAGSESNQGRHGLTPCESLVEITFERDGSCPVEDFQHFRDVYVWQIASRGRSSRKDGFDNKCPGLKKQDPSHCEKWPPRWLCAIYRYVTHPILECGYTRRFHRFRVRITERYVESALESTFWSKDVDWEQYLHSTDIQENLLRKSYELLCHSHPPSIAVDSVKFSKLLRECGVQPKFLAVGDAAYLFASHLASGSHYEMVFDGFERALEYVAHIMYDQQQQHQLPPLRRFCFDRLVHAPSMFLIWRDVVNMWRLTEKRKRMQAFADEYCAATRIRALWKQVSTRRVHIRALERMKAERLAATKIQSVFRMRVVRVRFNHLRLTTVRLQARIKARAQLRLLRQERAAFVERMRVRLVRWMKSRLRVLRAWKQLNALWVARRDRIWEKRQRMIAAAALYLETRGYRFYLYRLKSPDSASTVDERDPDLDDDMKLYELEIIDSEQSSCVVLALTRAQVASFEAEERRRFDSSSSFFYADRRKASTSQPTALDEASRPPETVSNNTAQVGRPGLRLRRSKPRPNAALEAITRRICLSSRTKDPPFYSNPLFTSLGKRLFFGAVRSDPQDADGNDTGGSHYHIVKLLQRADALAMTVFTPSTASTRRFDITAVFVYRVLQSMQFRGLSLPSSSQRNSHLDRADKAQSMSGVNTLLELVHILRGPWRLQALRCIVSYLTAFGTEEPNYSMMPEVRAAMQRAQEEERRRLQVEALARQTEIIVRVQSRARQLLARRARRQLALTSYRKQFDRRRQLFVYALTSDERVEVVTYDSKPSSLFDSDVPLPADDWEPVVNRRTGRVIHYANSYRGLISRFNNEQAARAIQRWFRRLMWVTINSWGLRQLVAALQFHRSVEKPSQVQLAELGTDARVLENAKRYAIQLHVLSHDYKAAFALYEAVLKALPRDAETLACLAVLLIASCRYPAKQTWVRAQQLLEEADAALVESLDSTLQSALDAIEDSCFCWALFLNPRDPEAIVNYAVFLQCVRREMDKQAEILYRRGLDVAPMNKHLVENYRRLRTHRAPDGLYAFAGPGKIALARAQELSWYGQWREMEDPAALIASTSRFFHCLQTGECVWTLPDEETIASHETSMISEESR